MIFNSLITNGDYDFRKAQVEVKNKKGNSPMWLAANGGHLQVVELLHKADADIDSQDNRKVCDLCCQNDVYSNLVLIYPFGFCSGFMFNGCVQKGTRKNSYVDGRKGEPIS